MADRPAGPEHALDLIVTAREQLADDVVGLQFEDPTGAALPQWSPGAHVDLILDSAVVRQYSLCSNPVERHRWRIGVLREPNGRGGSQRVHDELFVGTRVELRGPRNHFALQPARSYRFIAGGIGITPILPMIAAADAAGADWSLRYGGRRRSSMAFLDELATYGSRVTVWPQDERGLLPLDEPLHGVDADTLIYCCGPEGLLVAVERASAHWPTSALHVERFAARPSEAAASGGLDHFEVVAQRSGFNVNVGPGESILDAVRAHGVNLLSSCMEGICGTCETAVLEGLPHHRDSVLSDEEKAAGDCMMLCVSRSSTPRLVLDI